MGIINKPYTFSPNTTASSSEVNSDFDTIYNEFNGSIGAANLATDAVTTAKIADSNVTTAKIADLNVTTAKLADAGVTNAKLATGADEPGGAWNTWTPSWTNLTVGNGTVVAYYKKVGRSVFFRLTLTFGSTTSISGQVTVSLPVTSATLVARDLIAQGDAFDASATQPYSMRALWVTTTTMQCWVDVANATFVSQSALNATQPMTWTTSDIFQLTGFYEAAA